MIEELISVIAKNLKRLVRSKTSAILILLGPLVLIGVIGLAFNSSGLWGIQVSTYADSYSNTSQTFVDSLSGKDFKIIKEETPEICKKKVEDGESHICIVFPKEIGAGSKIEFYVDYSRINLVWTILEIVSSNVRTTSKDISLGLTEDLISSLKYASETLKESSTTMKELKIGSKNLILKINGINSELSNLNVGFDAPNNDIDEYQEKIREMRELVEENDREVYSDIKTTRQDLQALEATLETTRNQLSAVNQERNEIINSLNTVYTLQSCTSSNSKDLTPYLTDGQELNQQLESAGNPTCSLIYTMRENFETNTQELENIEQQMTTTLEDVKKARMKLQTVEANYEENIDEIKNDLEEAEESLEQAESQIEEAEQSAQELDSAKGNLQTELESMKQGLESSKETITHMETGLNQLQSRLGGVSSISPDTIISPVGTSVKGLTDQKTTLEYLFPSLIILVVMFVSLLLSGTLVMKEKSSKAYFRNLITPTKNGVFITGTYITALLVTMIQVGVIMFIGISAFGISLGSNILTILIIIALLATAFILIGMSIGNMLQSEETTTLVTIIIACILFLFSSMIIPLEKMTQAMASAAKLNPFVLGELLMRKALIYNRGLFGLGIELPVLIIEIIILSALALLTYRHAKKMTEK